MKFNVLDRVVREVYCFAGRYGGQQALKRTRPAGSVNQLLLGLSLALTAFPQVASAAWQCEADSPSFRMAVVELYTSEGCSSCPPADRWLSALADSSLSADKVLPLALHVDYWDYIGWKDRFASPDYTRRQREHAAQNRLRGLYTPQVVTSGRDTRSWHSPGEFLQRIAAITAQEALFDLSVSALTRDQDRSVAVSVKVTASDRGVMPAEPAKLHVVLFENELASRVSRGENAGHTLEHDRVVRHWARPELVHDAQTVERLITLPVDGVPANTGLAVFVQATSGDVLQAAQCVFKPVPRG